MCGIFGVVGSLTQVRADVAVLAKHSERRGKDASGLYLNVHDEYHLYRSNFTITKLVDKIQFDHSNFIMGHSRLVTNGDDDNQPVYRDSICVIHNGIVVNDSELWKTSKKTRVQVIDTEIIAALASEMLAGSDDINSMAEEIISRCRGVVSCAVALPKCGKLVLISNNGSLYFGNKNQCIYFASERNTLSSVKCEKITQIKNRFLVINIPKSLTEPLVNNKTSDDNRLLVPSLGFL